VIDALRAAELVAVGLAAGAVNTVAGAGSMFVLGALMLMGAPAHVANATNRIGVVAQAASATWAFERRGAGARLDRVEWAPAVAGGVMGAALSLVVSEAHLERAIALVLLLVVPTLWAPPGAAGRWSDPARAAAAFAVGCYGGFLQAGVGFLLLAIQVRGSGRDLAASTAGKVLLTGVFNVPALLVFAASGAVDWAAGALLAVGGAVGAWAGADLTLRLGAERVRVAVAVAAVALAVKLLTTP
jgi:uncharacterized membrane protein YfcA